MSHDKEERAAGILIFGIVIFACASFLTPVRVVAQRSPDRPSSGIDRARERQIRRNEQMDTSLALDALRRDSRQPAKEESRQVAYFQLQQDFEHLQTVNNQMMQMTFANKVVDYKRISEASSEIRKRAARLKSNLPLPEAGKEIAEEPLPKGWNELDQGEVKPALLALDDLIMSFVTNPVFQKPQVVDVQQSAKARRELEAIIKLSTKIKKSAEKLIKTPAKQS